MAEIKPVGVIDIGSNSVRLVVYAGPARTPFPIFNEKILAGLGRAISKTGRIDDKAWSRALETLDRFRLLLKAMRVGTVHCIATAAVRDAENGPDFVAAVEALGIRVRVLSAEEEAYYTGCGISFGIPGASGLAGDLGGGSLELTALNNGAVGTGFSLPLGVLRIGDGKKDEDKARKAIAAGVKEHDLKGQADGKSLFLIGGSWRALARVDMAATDFPLPITHQYRIATDRIGALRKAVDDHDWALEAASGARRETVGVAAMLLDVLVDVVKPKKIVVSTSGLREGLLYAGTSARVQQLDPLIEAVRYAAMGDRRFGQHGDQLDAWLAPLFDDDSPKRRRLRLAACLLADISWQANPFFRAERAIEIALHGNWVAVTAAGRVMMAQALAASFGQDDILGAMFTGVIKPADLVRANQWGLAMRLGQRLSGGVGSLLEETRLERTGGILRLCVGDDQANLANDFVTRRLGRLARAMDLSPEIRIG